MKKAFIRSGFLAVFLAALALSLTSCSDLAGAAGENAAPLPEGKAVLSIRLGSSSKARTALPEAESVEFSSFTLEGVPAESGYQTVSWQSSDGIADAEGELTTAEIVVTKGLTYTFTLTATTSGGAQYKDSKDLTIQDGENTLSFSLTLVSLGTGGTGNAVIGVTLPETESGNEITRLTVTVYTVSDDGTINSTPYSSELNEKEIPVTDKKAGFDSGDLPPGAYCAVFRLYGGEDGSALAGTWREFFGILGGLTSRSEINSSGSEKAVDELYAITYHANDTEEEPAAITAPKSYSRNSTVTLEAVMALSSRPGNKIEGWYTDQACTVSFTSTDGMTGDIELWAKWNEAYRVTFGETSGEHGTPAVDNSMQLAGESVTISVDLEEGYGLGVITVTAIDADGNDLADQPSGFPMTIARATTPKTFTMPGGLPYHGGVRVDVAYLSEYMITIGSVVHGSVITSKTIACPEDVITLSLSSDKTCYELKTLTVKQGATGISVSGSESTRTFSMPGGDVTVTAEFGLILNENAQNSGDIVVVNGDTTRFVPYNIYDRTEYTAANWTAYGIVYNTNSKMMVGLQLWSNLTSYVALEYANSYNPGGSKYNTDWMLPGSKAEFEQIRSSAGTVNAAYKKYSNGSTNLIQTELHVGYWSTNVGTIDDGTIPIYSSYYFDDGLWGHDRTLNKGTAPYMNTTRAIVIRSFE